MRGWKPLPAAIDFIESAAREQARWAAHLVPSSGATRPGATRIEGGPDRPLDAEWAVPLRGASYHDEEAFVLQLNLEEIPPAVRRPGWPAVGMVWVFINLADQWKARVEFDPRPSSEIPWPATRVLARAVQWQEYLCPPFTGEQRLPEIYWAPDSDELYHNWRHEQLPRAEGVTIGGWIVPIQGDAEEADATIVAELNHLHFGDAGAVNLHFDAQGGRWWAEPQTF